MSPYARQGRGRKESAASPTDRRAGGRRRRNESINCRCDDDDVGCRSAFLQRLFFDFDITEITIFPSPSDRGNKSKIRSGLARRRQCERNLIQISEPVAAGSPEMAGGLLTGRPLQYRPAHMWTFASLKLNPEVTQSRAVELPLERGPDRSWSERHLEYKWSALIAGAEARTNCGQWVSQSQSKGSPSQQPSRKCEMFTIHSSVSLSFGDFCGVHFPRFMTTSLAIRTDSPTD